MSNTDHISVAIKSRPFISREKAAKLRPQWNIQNQNIFQVDEDGHRLGEPYSFDHIFTEDTNNYDVYQAVVDSLVKSFLNGFNSTIFAYGQTSSGKTHTMMGTDSNPGIIQLAINEIFKHVACDNERRYLISCSYFEIYNEKINDLLDKNGQDLKIREDFCGNTFVNAKEEVVSQQSQVFELMKMGSKIRKIGCTNMNERSSRSHTIFRFTIKSTQNKIENGPVQISHLNLVDLAGSERLAHTQAAGVRRKEGVNINKSLLALGNVIRQLSEGEGFINYRDSNLTRLLQHALGGNAKSLIIATITIAAGEETKSTLEFAQRAMVIKNKPIINEILSEQDKLKQYELVTTNYKDRLEKERQRIQEMEQEKEEREREILRLKQQVKLIDVFTNGPQVEKTESKIPRRHTVGHYTPRIPLQTIPESHVLCPNVPEERLSSECFKLDIEDELFFKRASQESDCDFMKTIIEESIDDIVLSVTPEPQENLQPEEEGTPSSLLRQRLKCLEESYMSLQEFTKLEAQCKVDVVQDLTIENENLKKDVVDLNAIVKETRLENDEIKITFENELMSLRKDLEEQKKQNEEILFALQKSESEKDALVLSKIQIVNDNEFLLEQQKEKYEKQIEYFINEINHLNEQGEESVKIMEEMKSIKSENEKLKLLKTDNITLKDELLLEDTIIKEKEDFDILSVSTQTEEVESRNDTMANLEHKIDQLEKTNQAYEDQVKEFDMLNNKVIEQTAKIMHLEETILKLETQNKLFNEEIETFKTEDSLKIDEIILLKSELDTLHIERTNNVADLNLSRKEINTKDNTILALTKKIEKLEQDNDNFVSISVEKAKLEENFSQLQAENESFKKEIAEFIKENTIKDAEIMDLKVKLDTLQLEKTSNVEDLTLARNEQAAKDNTILALKENIMKLEQDNDSFTVEKAKLEEKVSKLQDENKSFKEEITQFIKESTDKDAEIMDLKYKLDTLQLEKTTNAEGLTLARTELSAKDNTILALKEDIMKLEQDNDRFTAEKTKLEEKLSKLEEEHNTFNEKITEFIKAGTAKDAEIMDLNSKLNNLLLEKTCNEDLTLARNELSAKDNTILALKEDIMKLEQDNDHFTAEKTKLEAKLSKLEQENNTFKEEIIEFIKAGTAKDSEIMNLNSKLDNLLLEKTSNEEYLTLARNELSAKDNTILELKADIMKLEQDYDRFTIEKTKLEEKLSMLEEENNTFKEEITELIKASTAKDSEIMDLNSKLDNLLLEKTSNEEDLTLARNELSAKDNTILALKEDVMKLEQDNNRFTIEKTKLEEKLSKLEEENKSFKEEITEFIKASTAKDSEIMDLNSKLDNLLLEKTSIEEDLTLARNELAAKDNAILALRERMTKLEKDNDNYISISAEKTQWEEKIAILEAQNQSLKDKITEFKKEIESKDSTISVLKKRNKELRRDNENYQQEINLYSQEFVYKESEVSSLMGKIEDLKRNSFSDETTYKEGHLDELEQKSRVQEEVNSVLKEELQLRDHIITEMKSTIKDLEETSCRNRQEIHSRDSEISNLTEKINNLENEIDMCNEKILELTNKLDALEIDNDILKSKNIENKKKLDFKEEQVSKLLEQIAELTQNVVESEAEISKLMEQIKILEDDNNTCKESFQTDIDLRDINIQLKKKTECLKTDNYNLNMKINSYNEEIEFKNKLILELDNLIKNVDETEDVENKQTNGDGKIESSQILVVNKVKALLKCNHKYKERIKELEQEITKLSTTVGVLEKEKRIDQPKVQCTSEDYDLNKKMKNLYMENSGLRTRIFDLENCIMELKASTVAKKIEKASSCRLSLAPGDLSPKEMRKQKRQSIYDERRGIDITADEDKLDDNLKELEDIKQAFEKLKAEKDHLTDENNFLEHEVQGFIGVLEDKNKYIEMRDAEIEALEEEIKRLKKCTECIKKQEHIKKLEAKYKYIETRYAEIEALEEEIKKLKECKECVKKQKHIEKLEELQKQNCFKVVNLKTEIYDLTNKIAEERNNVEEKERRLYYRIKELEKAGRQPLPVLKQAEIQCNIIDYQQLLEKYSNTKKLARIRREEGNILRARLGMQPDEPVD